MSRRTEMLGSTIQRELAEIIQRELTDPRLMGMPAITRVKVASDLSAADVFLTIMGTPGQQSAAMAALQSSAGLMRTRLTRSLSLRQAPFLKFHIDEDLKKELNVLNLIALANREREEREAELAARAAPAEDGGATVDEDPPKAESFDPEKTVDEDAPV